MNLFKTYLVILVALANFSCQIEDADYNETNPIESMEIQASENQLNLMKTEISGNITVGYTSKENINLKILVNGSIVLEDYLPSNELSLDFNYEIQLEEDINNVVVEAKYGDKTLSKETSLVVANALSSLAVQATEDQLHLFKTVISGEIELGYINDEKIHITISDNGTILLEDLKTTSDSSGLVVPFEYNVDLLDTGKNNLIVKVEYNQETISKNIELSSNMTSPEATFGSWSQVFTTGSGLLASSTVEITKNPSYTIEYVIFNYKDNSWINAEYVSANNYAIDLVNPDIGEQKVTIKIGASIGDQFIEKTFFDYVTIDPVFDCNSNPSLLMLPTTNLITNQNYENRTMVGYFGDPAQHHSIEFVISADVDSATYYSVGEPLNIGFSSINTRFNVDRLSCNNDPCSMTYDLEVYIDGVYHCGRTNFGDIYDY